MKQISWVQKNKGLFVLNLNKIIYFNIAYITKMQQQCRKKLYKNKKKKHTKALMIRKTPFNFSSSLMLIKIRKEKKRGGIFK